MNLFSDYQKTFRVKIIRKEQIGNLPQTQNKKFCVKTEQKFSIYTKQEVLRKD